MALEVHLPTVLLLHQSSLLVGAVVFMHLRRQSQRTKGLGVLVLAYGALAFGALAAGIGGRQQPVTLPDQIAAQLSIFLGMTGYTLVWVGFRILGDWHRRRQMRWALWLPLVCGVIGFLTGLSNDFLVRAVLIQVFGIGAMLASAWNMLRGYRTERLPSRRLLALTMCISAVSDISALVILAMGWDKALGNMAFLQILCNFAIALLVVTLLNERSEVRLRRAAQTDPLTGVGNRRWFMSHLPPTVLPGSALVIMDLDHFKHVNDRYGHSMGDQALVKFAGYVSSCLREGDAFARYGGEEFALYLPDVTPAVAFAVADRLRKGVAALVCAELESVVSITVSMGMAIASAEDGSWQALLKRADQALYLAKASGRNRVMVDGMPDLAA